MAVTRDDFEAAVAAYWGARDDQLTASVIAGAVAQVPPGRCAVVSTSTL
jgi:hypothetical protein